MKKIIVCALAAILSVSAFAEGQFGVVGGFTSSSLKLKDIDLKQTAGFHAGITYYQPLVLGFAVQPQLLYNVKGQTIEEALTSLKTKASLGYIELPVQLQYGVDLILLRPYVFVEPFVGYALGGKVADSKFYLSNLKTRLEYGLGVGGGVQVFNHVQVSVKYYWNFEDCSLNNYIGTVTSLLKERSSFDGLIVSASILF